jgi:hypothetical protein
MQRSTLIAAVAGFILGVLLTYLFLGRPMRPDVRPPVAPPVASGNYCCPGATIDDKCIKQTAQCPADKPVVVSEP